MGELFATAESRGATISECGLYRYTLWRRWDDGPSCLFVMLNPSTADAELDDPTIRRCRHFAKREGCGRFAVVNLFAFRATSPADMKAAADPVGPANAFHIMGEAGNANLIIAAWGAHGSYMGRDKEVLWMLSHRDIWRLGITKDGHPKHPLYLPNDAGLVRFGAA
jgi:hypothetical protein